jgi:hypothetical protein
MKIKGGYYIKARRIQESEIAHCPPHVREIWDWLLKEANHKTVTVHGQIIERGQCIRTYKDIQEGLHWRVGWRKMTYTKWQCEEVMKKLRTLGMITTKKTTRGIIITIVNYDRFQDPSNYEDHNKYHKEHHNLPQTHHTINKNEKNEKNVKEIGDKSPSQIAMAFFSKPDLQESLILKISEKYQIDQNLIRKEINKFIDYWTELNKSGTKQKWETQTTFQLDRRIKRWLDNARDFNKTTQTINLDNL